MILYLIRHGLTDFNIKHVSNDNPKRHVPLNIKGKAQANKAGRKLKGRGIEAIFVSQFTRTKQTAGIINKYLKVKIMIDKRLNERKFGFDGKPTKIIHKLADSNYFHYKPKCGETFQQEKQRTKSFLKDLKKKKYKTALIVSHEEPMQTMLVYLKRWSDKKAYSRRIGHCEFLKLNL
jgi:probable phosphoglycerate mutase